MLKDINADKPKAPIKRDYDLPVMVIPPPQSDYTVIEALDIGALERAIDKKLELGYTLVGGMTSAGEPDSIHIRFYQAVVRDRRA